LPDESQWVRRIPGLSRPAVFGAEEPELRASMMASQIVGLNFIRHVVGVPALEHADRTRLVAYLSQVFNLYLHGLPTDQAPTDGPASG
jgi:hypothetical protein